MSRSEFSRSNRQVRMWRETRHELNQRFVKPIWDAISRKQSSLPAWILQNNHGAWDQKEGDVWVYTIFLIKKWEPQEGEFWEERSDGSKILARIDPDSGEKQYFLSYESPKEDYIPIFQVEINRTSEAMVFIKETILSELDSRLFEIFRE